MVSEMTAPGGVVASQVDAHLWNVGGVPLVVPDGVDGPGLVLAQAGALLAGLGPWPVSVQYSGLAFELEVQTDGSVSAAPGTQLTPHVLSWIRPAGSLPFVPKAPLQEAPPVSSTPPVELVSVHHGSGATTWAQLLGFKEVTRETQSGPHPFVVLRSTLAGTEAAKAHTSDAAALLVVADAPGKVPAPVARAIRVLEGAAPIVRVPWVPALRGMNVVPEGPAIKKVAAKVAATVDKHRRK
jgi:hypothetical protein